MAAQSFEEVFDDSDVILSGLPLLPISVMTFQVMQRLEDAAERTVKLDWEQSTLLIVIALNPDKILRIGELSSITGFGKSTTSHRVSRLEKAKLVSYIDDPDDRRAVRVALTAFGGQQVDKLAAAALQVLDNTFKVQKGIVVDGVATHFHDSPYMTHSYSIQSQDADPAKQFSAVSWFWLNYNNIFVRIRKNLSASNKIPLVSLLVLLQLKNCGMEMTVGDLTQSLLLEKDRVSRAIKYLLKEEYIVRHRDIRDRRVVCLDLTTKGNELIHRFLPKIFSSITELQSFSDPKVVESLSLSAADYVNRVRKHPGV